MGLTSEWALFFYVNAWITFSILIWYSREYGPFDRLVFATEKEYGAKDWVCL